jgi:acyl-CoA dehydrogenase
MILAVWILLLLIAILILIYQRASSVVAALGLGALLVMLVLLTHPQPLILWITGALWILFALVFCVLPLRRWLISKRIMAKLARHLPKFSPTEQAVLSAGNVGWEVELFSGIPDLTKLTRMPGAQFSVREMEFLAGPVEKLCAMIQPWQINCQQQIPEPVWEYLKQQGFFGLVIPEEYGGLGFSAAAHAQVVMKLASVSTAVATVASVPNSLGPAELLLHYGADEQKKYYLPRLARGEEVPCFALTSPVAGSDASAIVDSGVVCRYLKDGQEITGIRLNWNKRYITLAPVTTLLGLAFQLYDPEHLLSDVEKPGITCALIPVNTPGVRVGRHHRPLNCAFPNGPTQGEDVFVGLDAIIGGVSQAGKGWQMLMERLAAGRSISLPSIAMGGIKIAAVASGAYARIRRQFNSGIGDFGGIQEVLARIAGNTYIAESLRLFSVAQADQGIHSATAAAISKYHVTELSRKIINAAMDIHGGKGICMGPHNYLAQLHTESPIAITVEGANILTRSLIIFGQGVLRCHPFLLQEIHAAQHGDIKTFDRAFFGHWRYLSANQLRAAILGLTNAWLVAAPKGKNRRYYQQLSRFSAIFAVVADILLITTGNALKRKELLSGRLGDLLSYLYMISAVLKYHSVKEDCEELAPLTVWACETLFRNFQQRLNDLLINLPNALVRGWLRLVIFPLGKFRWKSGDALTVRVAKLLMEPGAVRDFFRSGAYFGGPLSGLENTLQQIIAVEPLLQKLHRARQQGKIDGDHLADLIADAQSKQFISSAEATQIKTAEDLRMALINVDDFTHG